MSKLINNRTPAHQAPHPVCLWCAPYSIKPLLLGKAESPACGLCSGIGTLEHILSSCPIALGGGRYCWRHDQVLWTVAETISAAITCSKHQKLAQQAIHFIKAVEKPGTSQRAQAGLLSTAQDWQLTADLGKQLRFPESITATTLRPDLVLLSGKARQAVILELTVPWEDRIEGAAERKKAKYAGLVEDCHRNGWRTWCLPMEAGCRGSQGGPSAKHTSLGHSKCPEVTSHQEYIQFSWLYNKLSQTMKWKLISVRLLELLDHGRIWQNTSPPARKTPIKPKTQPAIYPAVLTPWFLCFLHRLLVKKISGPQAANLS